MPIDTIVFDFGGVLIDWNPRHLFRKVFSDESEMEAFLREICTDEWNAEQDRGRRLAEGTSLLVKKYPAKAGLIKLYYDRWPEMLNGPITGTVDILASLKTRYRVVGLTNWSNETFPIALRRYGFLQWFEGILVSGDEGMIKPDRAIFELLISRYKITPASTVFIDDNTSNTRTAAAMGFHAISFKHPGQLKEALLAMGVIL